MRKVSRPPTPGIRSLPVGQPQANRAAHTLHTHTPAHPQHQQLLRYSGVYCWVQLQQELQYTVGIELPT